MAKAQRKDPDLTKRQPLGRDAWVNAARRALIEEGTAGIEVNKLAKRLRAPSRSGFYWFFTNRQQLLDELLAQWMTRSTMLFEHILHSNERDGMREYHALIRLWVDETDFDPKWDSAMRDWARTSPSVQKAVQKVDQKRIGIIEQIFHHIGYSARDARIRARVTYYHQVGYYAMGVRETHSERVELIPYYRKVLTGR